MKKRAAKSRRKKAKKKAAERRDSAHRESLRGKKGKLTCGNLQKRDILKLRTFFVIL